MKKTSKDWRDKKIHDPRAVIRIGTLFSGIGAIEYAFKRLKLKTDIIFACDTDEFCKKTYIENFNLPEEKWFYDVRDLDGKKHKGKLDILVGGSPCQSFSMVGRRKGFEDTRGTLFYEFARVVKESKPKIFIFENVKGLTNHDGGNTFEVIKATFNELGYKYFYKVLNSRDYGIPQNRERIYIIDVYLMRSL
jgi:DNA (cytosine-5)-methyltransferase 1